MTEKLLLFYLVFEFILLIVWMPKLIQISDNSWVTLKRLKIPLLILLSVGLLAQVYIVLTQREIHPSEKSVFVFVSEFLVKASVYVMMVTWITVTITFSEMDARKFRKADLIITIAVLLTVIGCMM